MTGVVQRWAQLRGRWAFTVRPEADYASLYLLRSGSVWVGEPGTPPRRVGGDTLLLARPGEVHVVASHRDAVPLDARRFFASCEALSPLRVAYGKTGATARLVMGFMRLEQSASNPLLRALPSLITIDEDVAHAAGAMSTMQDLERELRDEGPGTAAIAGRLAEVLFLRIVRHWARAPQPSHHASLVAALSDARLARALSAVHANPAAPWTVDALAKQAKMSRTAFAVRCSELLGMGPMAYVRQTRVYRACEALRDGDRNLAQIAENVGYASPAAFSRQFKRELGTTPLAFRQRLHARGPSVA